MRSLHSKKVAAEKDAFLEELFSSLPKSAKLTSGGELATRARRLHEQFLAVHILTHYKAQTGPLQTNYFELIISHAIECECLFVLGFYNAGMMLLRAAFEAATKLFYYENHPVEWQLHQTGKHDLQSFQYRDFLYNAPQLGTLPFHDKSSVERLWTDLCKFVHCDLRAVSQLGVVGDIKTVLGLPEQKFAALLHQIHDVTKIIVACCFAVDGRWLADVEKAYFDAVFDIYNVAERSTVKSVLRIT